MKSSSALFSIAAGPHYNPEELAQFDSFTKEDSGFLYYTIDLNTKEIVSQANNKSKIYFCFDERDKDFLPAEFSDENDIIYYDSQNQNILKILNEKYFSLYKNNILLFSNSIGVTHSDINKALNLLTLEDDTVVEGKSGNNNVIFIGMNYHNSSLLEELNPGKITHNDFLLKACRENNFIYTINGFISIHDINDFRKLYTELSKKESLNYCSPKIHEKFTHLFIEYKELLK